MEDNLLIERVLSISVLKDAILEMSSKTGALNLVEPGWEEILNNNALVKKNRDGTIRSSKGVPSKNDKVHVKNIIGMSNCLKVIVVGYWCLNVPGDSTEKSALNPCVELDIEYPIISSNVPSITYPDESFIGCIPNSDEKSDTEDGPSCKKMKY
ncbi:hypothetical protein TNIN_285041 [Trichonephila inaurata madagascariensis]|uniref:Uncharacterized protein n=1 Tax=Trichonephila inaurata madagascariensis TaxID=2747483 RepID=A0A8X6X909_9ARAC|nr:hypothetical protein TNIN_285041 [Trichonephila inaurata madagascariensis]